MYIEINFDSDIPIYLQIRNEIIKKIASGNLKNGDSLPSVRQMSATLEINLHTINKGYNLLKSEGYVNVDRRSGVTINVSKNESFDELVDEKLSLLIAQVKAKGFSCDEFIKLSKKIYDDF